MTHEFELLKESLSPIVYHWKSLTGVRKILSTNTFTLDVAFGTSSDMHHQSGRLYFLSTSRIKWGGYTRSEFSPDHIGVLLELDGAKLNQTFKAKSVDYWGPTFRNPSLAQGDTDWYLRNDENEDRLISNHDTIPNAVKYIRAIHVYVPPKVSTVEMEGLKDIEKRFRPTFFYVDPNTFKVLNTRKASMSVPHRDAEEIEQFSFKDMEPEPRELQFAMELYRSKDLTNLSPGASQMMWKLYYGGYNIDDTTRSIEAFVHNYKNSPKNRPVIVEFGRVMLHAHAKSIKEFIELLAKRIQTMKND